MEKWLKMVKNWDKYRNSEKVPYVWLHFHLLMPHNVLFYFCFILIFFPILLLLTSFPSNNTTARLNRTLYYIKPQFLKPLLFVLNSLFLWFFHLCVQLVKRVYKGVPLQLRGQAWALLLDVEKVKQDNKGKYEVR